MNHALTNAPMIAAIRADAKDIRLEEWTAAGCIDSFTSRWFNGR